ncbi:Ig-like domain-containing protein [Flammeovirga agarivorans]|uniref:Tandem-95 repeat protein n=1 Tax=Flammeovirga agarivorans TaxID=2726742 RepID=A0A7X8XUG6_9BACT|nr:Ig-like domain-containing protein [Flammeovirga agarivorans]NLR90362.1 tandem-95 repeat protein [Flammeovirga agarivorans]
MCQSYRRTLLLLITTFFPLLLIAQSEICDNGIDDDGDGLIDCFDPDCTNFPGCDGFYFGNDSATCQVIPPIVPNFNIVPKFSTDPNVAKIEQRSGVMVADLDLDSIPELVGKSMPKGEPGFINIFSGADGKLLQQITEKGNTHAYTQVAIGDVDKNKLGDIFVNEGRVVRRYEYLSDRFIAESLPAKVVSNMQTPQLADFNGDGVPEVYLGNSIFNAITLAELIAPDSAKNSGSFSYNMNSEDGNKIEDAYPLAYDVFQPGDSNPNGGTFGNEVEGLELIAGGKVYAVDIAGGTLTELVSCPLPSGYDNHYRPGDGFVSIGDFTGNNKLEVIVASKINNKGISIYLWSPYTQTYLGNYVFENSDKIGRCNLGDFDNDGMIEVGTAGKNQYVVLEYDAGTNALVEKWKKQKLDDGSQMTGSTLFDFDGDGNIEVVYSEEENLFIWRWDDDSNTFIEVSKVISRAGTRTEYPLVADVNADGQAEIVMSAQDVNGPDSEANGFIQVWGSYDSPWVSCRNLWNQHGYHVTNINDDLTIPIAPQDNFNPYFEGTLNSFLSQTPFITDSLNISFATPDLIIPDIEADLSDCADGSDIPIFITIENQGDWSAALGTPVTLYNGDPYSSSSASVIDTVLLRQTIQPGESTIVNALVPQDGTNTIELYILANHNPYAFDGSTVDVPLPADTVYTPLLECDYSNNLSLKLEINGCVIPPTLDLDNNNSSGIDGADYNGVYYRGSLTSGVIADIDTKVTLLGTDFISYADISLTKIEATDSLIVRGTLPGSLTWSYTDEQRVVRIEGGGTKAEFEEALKLVYFSNNDLTDFTQRTTQTILRVETTSVSSNTANSFITIKSRPTSQDETITIDEDTYHQFSESDFLFNDEDGDTFDGIRVSYPLDPLNFHGRLVYDGDTLTPYQLTLGHEIPDVTLLRYYPIADESNDNYDPYSRFNFRVKDNTGIDLNNHHSIRHLYTINVTPVNDPPISKDSTGIAPLNVVIDQAVEDLFYFSSVDASATYKSVIIKSLPVHSANTVFQRDNGGGSFVDIAIDDEIPVGTDIRYEATSMVGTDPINYDSIHFKVVDNRDIQSVDEYTFTVSLLIDLVILDFYKIGQKNTDLPFNSDEFNNHYHNITPTVDIQNVIVKSLPANGTLVFNGSDVALNQSIPFTSIDQLLFRPDTYWHGLTSFNYAVEDENGDMSSEDARIFIFIENNRHNPVALDDFSTTVANQSIFVDALVNDTDADGDSIYIRRINATSHGSASIVDGQVYFVPEDGYVGSDVNGGRVSYTITDGIDGESTAIISINILNDAPTVGDLYYGGYVGDTIHFTYNDFNARFSDSQDLDKIKFTSLPSEGTIYMEPSTAITVGQEIDAADISSLFYIDDLRNLEVLENFNWNGSDGIQYADVDGNVRIQLYTKTHPPTAIDDQAQTFDNTPVLIDVLDNDFDQDGDSLIVTTAYMAEREEENGVVKIINNQVEFTPTRDFRGLTYARYYITDDRDGYSEALIRIIVSDSPDSPEATPFEKYGQVNEDLPLSLVDFENHYSDPNNLALDSVGIEQLSRDGQMFLGTTAVTLGQRIHRSQLDQLLYRPNTDYVGDDHILYSVNNGSHWSGTSSRVTFHIVENLDDIIPVVVDISKSGDENQDIPITLSDFQNAFTDPMDSAMVSIVVLSLPENGELTYNDEPVEINETFSVDSLDQLIYTPDFDFAGDDQFEWNATNGRLYAEESAFVLIDIGPELVIYSSFTPNNDGINDYWHIKDIEFYPNNEVTIYNRWGNVVYNSNGYNNADISWDGTNNGNGAGNNVLPAATYFYKVDLKDGSPVRSGYVVLAK